ERGFTSGVGNTVRLFLADPRHATDTSGIEKRTSRDIRTANRYEVLRQIIAQSPTSRQTLATATGLSVATVATLVGELLDLRMITEVG
ncbi:hypothetical protein ABZ372_39660, partial [Streptomyces sp. NPDC005921]